MAAAFAFEEVLDFNAYKRGSLAYQKQLACVRCRAQKLGCILHELNGT